MLNNTCRSRPFIVPKQTVVANIEPGSLALSGALLLLGDPRWTGGSMRRKVDVLRGCSSAFGVSKFPNAPVLRVLMSSDRR